MNASLGAVEEGDCHCFDALPLEAGESRINVAENQRSMLAAILVHASTHTPTQVAWHKHGRVGLAMIPLVLPQTTPDFKRIAETLSGQQTHFGALAFDHAVGRHGRAVDEERAVAKHHTHTASEFAGESLKCGDHTQARVHRH
jgi:hypothetical protein